MSTNVNYTKTTTKTKTTNQTNPAVQHRRQTRCYRRILRMILFAVLTLPVVILSTCYVKSVQALNKQITELSDQAAQLADKNQELSGSVAQLTEKTHDLNDRVAQLSEEKRNLSNRVVQLSEEKQALDVALQEARYKLEMLVGDDEIKIEPVTIYNIPLSAALQEYTYLLCADYYIPEHYELVLAMMWQESSYRANVISHTNDYGLMQINVINHEWLSDTLHIDDFLDPYQNIHAGVYMISKLIHKYGDISKALMAYNMGERGAERCWDAGKYSTSYSESIIAKQAAVKADNYTG